MVYITVRQSPMYRQMSLDELLFEDVTKSAMISSNVGNTKTYRVDRPPERLLRSISCKKLIRRLKEFNDSVEHLRSQDRSKLYYTFFIPKKTGGVRRIDAPDFELMDALRELKRILEDDFGALYHTSAFAYVKHRCTVDAVKRHQANNSKWFAKFDLSNFFGNTTLDFVMKQLSMIYPFSEVMRKDAGRYELERAIELGFLNGGLPQGTPLSPTLTNIMMIPVDHKLANLLSNFNDQHFVYTRYADDFIISSRRDFSFKTIEDLIVNTLNEFGATFSLNKEKTRYGSSAGSNWNLGVMLNANNEITIGRARKRRFEAVLTSYIADIKRGTRWSQEDAQVLAGQTSYYRMVEGETIDRIISHINQKNEVDVMAELKKDLK